MLKLRCRAASTAMWARPDDIPEPLWQLLRARGISSQQHARAFLNPSERDLVAPLRLHDMARAVARIHAANKSRETICVWGDYDVDGVSAAAILTGVLTGMGIDAFAYIPSRHTEGYGLNEQGILQIAPRAALLITVDCGVSELALVDLAKHAGLDVIVTDHHRPGDALPDCPVVNPLLDDYPNPALCGAGVAFKLALALDERLARGYIDLAALATVADVVSLTGENRALVALGLAAMNELPRPGIAALMDVAGLKPGTLSAGRLAFQLAPRLNAGGRVGSARRALELLTCDARIEADGIARELDAENTARRAMELHILKHAEAQLQTYDLARMRVIVLSGDDWNPGVIGLAASRLAEKYYLPCVLLAGGGETLTGSCRSIPGVDIFECLTAVHGMLTRYGGHRQAAGLTIERARIDAFRAALNEVIERTADPDAFIPSVDYDMQLGLDELTVPLVHALERIQPTGYGNPAPVLLAHARVDETRAIGRDGAHLSLTLSEGDARLRGVWFGEGRLATKLLGPARPVLYAPRVDEYMGRASLQAEVKAMGALALDEALALNEPDEERLRHLFLTQRLYNKELLEPYLATPVHEDALEAWLERSPRGTLIAAADLGGAQALLTRLHAAGLDGRIDVFTGHWPDDRRAFNALCVLPAGDAPRGYERLIALNAPASFIAPGFAGEAFELGEPARWLAALPDVDALRTLFVAARALLKRPYAATDAGVLARELSELSGLNPAAAHAGLYALRELNLVEFEWGVRPLTLKPTVRVEPDQSRVFQLLTHVRTWAAQTGMGTPPDTKVSRKRGEDHHPPSLQA